MKKILSLILIVINFTAFSQNYDYDVTHYTLNLKVNPAIYFIKGNVIITLKTTKITESIAIDLTKKLQVDSIICNEANITFNHNEDIIKVNFTSEIPANSTISLNIYYHGEPNSNSFGSFNTSTHNGIPIMWTLSEPYGASDWWPCKNTLNDKADSIDLYITTPKQYSVASNGLRISENIIGDSVKITHWKHKYPITAYLIAFAVTNYSTYYDYATIGDSVTIPIMEMVYPEDSARLRKITPLIVPVIQFYSKKFGVYPFYKEKYGQAEFPWGGGMEHQTMTFIGVFNHSLMAHELAHHWFGDYITCGSWQEIWLNEGFAVFLEGLTAEAGLAPYSFEDWKIKNISGALENPSGSVFVEDTSNTRRVFSHSLTYMKGGFILQMLRKVVGDSAFFAGVRAYINDTSLAYGYAHVSDLKKHIETAADTNLTEFFNDWYYGQGYPKYTIKWWQKQNYLIINVKQEDMSGNNNFFEMPLSFKIIYNDHDSIIKFQNDYNNQNFIIKSNGNINDVIFDPNKDILTKDAIVKHLTAKKQEQIQLSPNPADSIIYVSFKTAKYIKEIDISDLNGKILQTKQIHRQAVIIPLDISNFEKGTYILKIKTKGGTSSKIFIKR